MKESPVLHQIRAALCLRPDTRVFRNNIGMARTPDGTPVKYGIPGRGGSDLIGWRTVTIIPDMVGQRLAVFTAIEVKRQGADKTSTDLRIRQGYWREAVKAAGGIAGIARSVEDAEKIVYGGQE